MKWELHAFAPNTALHKLGTTKKLELFEDHKQANIRMKELVRERWYVELFFLWSDRPKELFYSR